MNLEKNNHSRKAKNIVLPGDKLATIEEFEPGQGTTASRDIVISSIVGEAISDLADRVVSVTPAKAPARLPRAGDFVTGIVESASSTNAQVVIRSINDIESNKELSAMLSLREDRRRRSGPALKPSDVLRAKVISTLNSIYQLSLDCDTCGAIYTVCSVCGGSVVALGRDRIKCRECGTVDERLLAPDFVVRSRERSSA